MHLSGLYTMNIHNYKQTLLLSYFGYVNLLKAPRKTHLGNNVQRYSRKRTTIQRRRECGKRKITISQTEKGNFQKLGDSGHVRR
jgi:hypothetical protein